MNYVIDWSDGNEKAPGCTQTLFACVAYCPYHQTLGNIMKFAFKSTRKGAETQVAFQINRRTATIAALVILGIGCLIFGFDPTAFIVAAVAQN